MSRFNNAARRVLASDGVTTGWDWIALHRCIEAYCRTTGESFVEVFDRLARDFGVQRGRSLPPTARLRAAVLALRRDREALLAERRTAIAARRVEKAAGVRRPPATELDLAERARTRRNEGIPRVGPWGWARVRTRAWGPPIPAAKGLFDLRSSDGWTLLSVPGGETRPLDVALTTLLADRARSAGQGLGRLVVRVSSTTWHAWCDMDPTGVVSPMRPLERLCSGPRSLWIRGRLQPPDAPSELERLLRARRWAVARMRG